MNQSQTSKILKKISDSVGTRPADLAVTVQAATENPFRVLVATILSLRAVDSVVADITPKLLERAPDAASLAAMEEDEISQIIRRGSFHKTKAHHLRELAKQLIEKHQGKVPDNFDDLIALKGVGRKSANLVLSLAFKQTVICVDTHVFSISNRLGFTQSATPYESEIQLKNILPEKWWIPVNGVLIAFGKTVCRPRYPICSQCPVKRQCPKIGVSESK